MKRVVGYVRVSTEEQSRGGVSLTMQAEKLTAYCQLHDIELTGIVEESQSAKSIGSRPGFMSALEQVYSGKADGLLIWKLDRAFRSTQDALATAERLNKRGRALISVSENLDTKSAMGNFVFCLMASLAELERKLIGERTSAALQSKRNRCETTGQVPFGFTLAADGIHLEPCADEQKIIRIILDLKAQGYSFRKIAEKLNEDGYSKKEGTRWNHPQVARVYRRAA